MFKKAETLFARAETPGNLKETPWETLETTSETLTETLLDSAPLHEKMHGTHQRAAAVLSFSSSRTCL